MAGQELLKTGDLVNVVGDWLGNSATAYKMKLGIQEFQDAVGVFFSVLGIVQYKGILSQTNYKCSLVQKCCQTRE